MVAIGSQAEPDFMQWSWADMAPQFQELEARNLSPQSVEDFVRDWSELSARIAEIQARLHIGTTRDVTDTEVAERMHAFLDEDFPRIQSAQQRLRTKLLASGLVPNQYDVALRKMRAASDLFREENLALLARDEKLKEKYFKVTGAQTVRWEGEERTLQQMAPVLQEPSRETRERAWRLVSERELQDRGALNELWRKLLPLRGEIATNAGLPTFLDYSWTAMNRFDYTPEEARTFHQSVEEVVVPAVKRNLERRRRLLGVDTLRPWDLAVDPLNRPPLRPFKTVPELIEKASAIFHRVDPRLGEYYNTMVVEGLLDLESRKNKAPGGYCSTLSAARRPFIFGNLVGTRGDTEVLLHEGGHAFHTFESANLPFEVRDAVGAEFAEVSSMAMELLSGPYLEAGEGGFYSPEDAARARIEHLEERVLMLWPSIMIADAFQHWAYRNPGEAKDPAACDATWAQLTRRFIPVVDWEGLDDVLETGWHNLLHIFVAPLYMIEYALAQLGAVQIWANARRDHPRAISRYRAAMALGDTRPLPDLFATAGARFAFDSETLREAVAVIEQTIQELSPA
ncbi:MAG: M3 family oligoendopeptidase [Chloroflexota bacterium]